MLNTKHLLEILVSVRERLAQPSTNFVWSSWQNAVAALGEMDSLIVQVQAGHVPTKTLDLLFAPTGNIQEVSISNGWGDEFLRIAEAYDGAIVALGLRAR